MAMRSALVMLGRRCCGSSGSATAVSMAGERGLAVHHVFRTSAPLLRPSARNLELQGLHRFSTGGMDCAGQKKHKAENVLRLWWQRSSDHLKNDQADSYVKNCRSIRLFGTIFWLASLCYLVMMNRSFHRRIDDRITRTSPLRSPVHTKRKGVYCALPPNHPWRLLCGSSL